MRVLHVSHMFGIAFLLFAPAAANAKETYKELVQPILAEHCFDCHGADDQSGGLRFDELAGMFATGDSGKQAIVPGDIAASELITRIRSTDEDLQMPPDGPSLSSAEVDKIEAWIRNNAEQEFLKVRQHGTKTEQKQSVKSDHWAFQPINSQVEIPTVNDATWPRSDIDRFLLSAREDQNLTAVEDAAPETLIRRMTFALTGLPPTVDEIERFVASVDSNGTDAAIAAATDELLSRPTYGERWGRHWMDWVRYADTAGDNSDFPIPQAFRYRNYIIDALNEDLPYDQFVTEQLAGDLLPYETFEERNRQVIATGYLAMARRFGSLVETYPWHLTIEDTIDNIGKTMLGVTIACARCHDHKFDPISTREYYGIYGIFESTKYPFPGIELFQVQDDLVPLIPSDEVEKLLGEELKKSAKLSRKLQEMLAECRRRERENAELEKTLTLDEKRKLKETHEKYLKQTRNAGSALAKHLKSLPAYDKAYAVQENTPMDAAIQIKGEPTRPGAVVPRGFPSVLAGYSIPSETAAESSGRLELAKWITSPENPLSARVIVNRIWQRHFGQGIVATTSDFGLRGQQPSHPELLDYLATEFIKNGWSLKWLHRQIMNSRSYRLSSSSIPEPEERDPDNRMIWRFNRQRLDAESLRDALMFVSGELDLTPQLEPHPFPEQSKWEYTQHHPFKDEYESKKRSVYLMTKRLTAKSYFQTFDGPDPNVCTSKRDQSVTALQALFFSNDTFLHEQAEHFASQITAGDASDEERIRLAFKMAISRDPTPDETKMLQDFLHQVALNLDSDESSETKQWASLARCLFRMNEFIYLD